MNDKTTEPPAPHNDQEMAIAMMAGIYKKLNEIPSNNTIDRKHLQELKTHIQHVSHQLPDKRLPFPSVVPKGCIGLAEHGDDWYFLTHEGAMKFTNGSHFQNKVQMFKIMNDTYGLNMDFDGGKQIQHYKTGNIILKPDGETKVWVKDDDGEWKKQQDAKGLDAAPDNNNTIQLRSRKLTAPNPNIWSFAKDINGNDLARITDISHAKASDRTKRIDGLLKEFGGDDFSAEKGQTPNFVTRIQPDSNQSNGASR